MSLKADIKCNQCDFVMVLKIGQGSEPNQPHIFDCPDCDLPITIAVKKNPSKFDFVECVENCSFPQQHELKNPMESGRHILCLHSSFAYTKEMYHSPLGAVLTTTMGGQRLYKFVQKRWPSVFQKDPFGGIKMIDTAHLFDVPNCELIWKNIIKPYNIWVKNNQPTEKLESLKQKYIKEREKYVPRVNVSNHNELYHDFFSSMFYPLFNEYYVIINNAILEAKNKNIDNFKSFIEFYRAERWENSQEQFVQNTSNYFSLVTEFAQMRVYARTSDSDVGTLIVGSKNFDQTKQFYGNIYEHIADECIFLVGIFNLINGRNFDQLASCNLNKFINDFNKEKRISCVSQHQEFKEILSEMNGTLRNGSHHASIRRVEEILFYRPGGTGAESEVPYSQYLYLSNRLMILATVLFCLEHKWLSRSL